MIKLSSRREFIKTIRQGITLIAFQAPWSSPCQAQTSILDDLEEAFRSRISIASLNVERQADTAMRFEIQSIPTTLIFREGHEVTRFIGLQDGKTLSLALENMVNDDQTYH